jgi:prepilin signal peptidase PulO-like enzyme (type II secretory pathway)
MVHPAFFDHALDAVQWAAFIAVPDLPLDAWWLPVLVLFVLGVSATIDALTGTIPDWIIFLGIAAVVLTEGIYMDWPFAAAHLRPAVAAGIGLWLFNLLWRRQFKGDAYGMGDAKWTILAVAMFGFAPSLFAWGAAAVLAVMWMGVLRLARRKIDHVHFGPFLFLGLLAGIYWLKLR